MQAIRVTIGQWIDDHQPGSVEFKLTDHGERTWLFIEKVAYVTDEDLSRYSVYPKEGVLACRLVDLGFDTEGREVAQVDTASPLGITSVDGVSRFHVFADQLVEIDGL